MGIATKLVCCIQFHYDRLLPTHLPKPLSAVDKSSESIDRLLVDRFKKLSRYPEAFSSVQYLGTQTLSPPTDFGGLQNKLAQLLDNNATRSPRTPVVIFRALQVKLHPVGDYQVFLRWSEWVRVSKVHRLVTSLVCWCLQALSERFNGEIAGELIGHNCFFPDEYFTCSCMCLSCGWVFLPFY